MKVLILGEKNYIDEFLEYVNDDGHYIDVYYWDIEFGPELLLEGKTNEYDVVVVAYRDPELSKDLYYRVVDFTDSNSTQVLNFNALYKAAIPSLRVDAVMSNPAYDSYETMILGISHAEIGIIPNRLSKPACNLAITSQDIYYNIKNLEYVISNYWHKIKNVKNIILDMYDFNYFNFDLSLSKVILHYIEVGGYYMDNHNIENNRNFDNFVSTTQIKEYYRMQQLETIKSEDVSIWQMLFSNIYKMHANTDYYNYWNTETRLKKYDLEQTITYEGHVCDEKNRYEHSIKENIGLFDQLLDLIYKTWPDVNLSIIILPLPKAWKEFRHSKRYEEWETEYMDIISKTNEKYPFKFKSYLDDKICDDLRYFQDKDHLNYIGAVKFTKMVEQELL